MIKPEAPGRGQICDKAWASSHKCWTQNCIFHMHLNCFLPDLTFLSHICFMWSLKANLFWKCWKRNS